ncbi:MAG: zinc finger MYND domain-containing protein, partial [Desulfobacteraceae bacterium]|nr:zinc finger MYND domain-containing protein [Desulfobacteraceae bacterium]
MSSKSDEDEVCACCGIAAVDDVKLEDCNGGCDLVKYCSDKCQENHREQHEEECKNRKAELPDKELFEQPDGTYLGECPICFLPLPLHPKKSRFHS